MGDTIRNAERALQILNDDVFKDVTSLVEGAIIKQLENCPLTDQALQNKLVLMLQIHKRYLALLHRTVENGEVAEDMLSKKTLFNRRGI